MDHHLYLLRAFLTHAVVGYAVVRGTTRFPAAAAVVGALAPDLDLYLGPVLGVPVVHRGVLHTPAAVVVLTMGVLFLGSIAADAPRRAAAAFAIGYLTHLVVDSFTPAGIMWLYPASPVRLSPGIPIHGAFGTAALWVMSLGIVLLGPGLGRRVRGGGGGGGGRTSNRRE